MKLSKLFTAIILASASVSSHAALFSLSNATASRSSGTATMTVSLTGDGVTAVAQADIIFPTSYQIISATGCSMPTSRNKVVRALVFSQSPIASTPNTICQITFSVNSESFSQFIPIQIQECGNSLGQVLADCSADNGFVTVIP